MELIKFWAECRLDTPPFVHPQDRAMLTSFRRGDGISKSVDFLGHIHGDEFGRADARHFHLGLVPVPYSGDIRKADIYVLQLNPGFSVVDYHAESNVPEFRRRIQANLYQDFDGIDFPFLYLDPAFCWHSGFTWWEGKFRDIARELAAKKHRGSYRNALREFSRRVAALELVP